MAVERELVAIGIIAGTIEVSRVQELYKIAGVRDVEPSRSNYRLDTPQNQKS